MCSDLILTFETSCCRSVCVPDACSLLFSAQVELKGKEIFEWLFDRYEVYICPEVKYECFRNIQKGRVEMSNPGKFRREVSRKEVQSRIDYGECLEYLEKYCDEKGMSEFLKLGDGEKNSVALSLYLNTQLKKPILFLVDDYDALKIIAPILNEQKFAIQKSVPDFIINLFRTDLTLNENQVKGALQSYYNIMRSAALHKTFKNRMKLNCRSFWVQKCGVRCALTPVGRVM